MPVTVPCTKCGYDMDLSDDLVKLAAGKPVSMQHGEGLCPTDPHAPPPKMRQWRCEVTVFELGEPEEGSLEPTRERFAFFAHDTEATTLQVALPKLADGIGRQWEQAVEHAPFADQPVAPDEGPVVDESPEPERPVETVRLPDDDGAVSSAPSTGPGHDPAPSSPEKRPARDWQEQYGRVIVDPDGWRGHGRLGALDPATAISYDEFCARAAESTTGPPGLRAAPGFALD